MLKDWLQNNEFQVAADIYQRVLSKIPNKSIEQKITRNLKDISALIRQFDNPNSGTSKSSSTGGGSAEQVHDIIAKSLDLISKSTLPDGPGKVDTKDDVLGLKDLIREIALGSLEIQKNILKSASDLKPEEIVKEEKKEEVDVKPEPKNIIAGSLVPESHEPLASDTVSPEPLASDTVSPEPLASDTVSTEPLASDTVSAEPLASDTVSTEQQAILLVQNL